MVFTEDHSQLVFMGLGRKVHIQWFCEYSSLRVVDLDLTDTSGFWKALEDTKKTKMRERPCKYLGLYKLTFLTHGLIANIQATVGKY